MIRILHLECGHPHPFNDSWYVKTTLTGIEKAKGCVVHRKTPVAPDILLHIKRCLNFSCVEDCVLWAACLVLFFGLLRKSNLFQDNGDIDASKQLPRDCFLETEQSTITVLETEHGTVTVLETEQGTVTVLETEQGTVTVLETEQGTVTVLETEQSTVTVLETEQSTVTVLETEQSTVTVHVKWSKTLQCREKILTISLPLLPVHREDTNHIPAPAACPQRRY